MSSVLFLALDYPSVWTVLPDPTCCGKMWAFRTEEKRRHLPQLLRRHLLRGRQAKLLPELVELGLPTFFLFCFRFHSNICVFGVRMISIRRLRTIAVQMRQPVWTSCSPFGFSSPSIADSSPHIIGACVHDIRRCFFDKTRTPISQIQRSYLKT